MATTFATASARFFSIAPGFPGRMYLTWLGFGFGFGFGFRSGFGLGLELGLGLGLG